MNIVLNQKDADFILSYFRENLEASQKAMANLEEKMRMLEKETDPFLKILGKGISEVLTPENEAFKQYQEHQSKIVKCIELLTIGSVE